VREVAIQEHTAVAGVEDDDLTAHCCLSFGTSKRITANTPHDTTRMVLRLG
jgi:hypothetical protein